jgi:catechol 2,3-dioxygenase-like lactoylglutathione lyase family enzyme
MLSDKRAGAILPAVDLARAKAFYTGALGLKLTDDDELGFGVEAGGGTEIFVYPYGETKAEHTALGFRVADIEAEVAELRAKGIVEIGGIKGAFFKDTEGKIIGLVER